MRLRHDLLKVALVFLILSVSVGGAQTHAQSSATISYGDTVQGEVKNDSKNYAVFYFFDAGQGDTVSVSMVRKSGNLRPYVILADPQETDATKVALAQSELSSDGTTATLSEFTIEKAGQYAIVATRENYGTGTTSGKYELTFDGNGSGNTPTDTPVPTRRSAPTATRKPRVTPTAAAPSVPTADIQVDTFQVGASPTYSVWSGNNLFVANYGAGTVSVLDGNGKNLASFAAGVAPFALAWDGARLWVADIGTNDKPGDSVLVFDPKGRKLGAFKVGKQPFSMSYDPENKRMWVAVYGENKVVALDSKGAVVTTIDVSDSGSNPNTVLWAGNRVWITLAGTDKDAGNSLIEADGDGNITGSFTVGTSPSDLAWDDAGQTLYVANYGDGTVTALDADGLVKGTYPVGKNPAALVFAKNMLWVTLSGENGVAAMTSKGKLQVKIPLGNSPNGICFDGENTLWIALQGTSDKAGDSVARIAVDAALGG